MIKLTEIRESLLKKLSTELEGFKEFQDEEDPNFFKPSFVIEVIPVSSNHLGRCFEAKKSIINIKYFSKNGTNSEIIEMTDKLNEVFKNGLYIKDHHFSMEKKDFSIEKKVLNYKIPLEFEDSEELVEINTDNGAELIPSSDLDNTLGYSKETLKTMKELKIREDH